VATQTKRSRFRLLPLESWSPALRILVSNPSVRGRWIFGIFLSVLLAGVAYTDVMTGDRVNLKPLCGLLVLFAFLVFRFHGIWWLLGTVGVYQVELSLDRLRPSQHVVFIDDVIVAVAFGLIGLMIVYVHEGLTAVRQSHEDMRRDLQLAGAVQRQFISPPLDSHKIFVEGYLRPTGEVGGDFYIITSLDADRVFFAIGDVQGKGVSAALMMAKIVGIFSESVKRGESISKLLSEVNERLCADESPLVTAFIGIGKCLEDGRVRLSFGRAGHEPGYLIRHQGKIEEITPSGIPLAVFPGEHFEECEIVMSAGDRILLFTDGLTDTRNADRVQFGRDRLAQCSRKFIGHLHEKRVSDWIAHIVEEVDRFRGDQLQEDDMALLGIGVPRPSR